MWCVGVLACGSVDGEGSSLCGASKRMAISAAMVNGKEELITIWIGCFYVAGVGCIQSCGRVDRRMILRWLLSVWVGRDDW